MKTKQTTVETWLTARDRSSLLHKKSDVLFGGQKKKDEPVILVDSKKIKTVQLRGFCSGRLV